MRVSVYSIQGYVLRRVSRADADQLLATKHATRVLDASRRDVGVRLVELERESEISPCAINAGDMQRAAEGNRRAISKIRWWPTVGLPPFRHAMSE